MSLLQTFPDLEYLICTKLKIDIPTLQQFCTSPTRCVAQLSPRRHRCPNRIKGDSLTIRSILSDLNASQAAYSDKLDRLAKAAFCSFHQLHVKAVAEKCRELEQDDLLVEKGLCRREDLSAFKETRTVEKTRTKRPILIFFSGLACSIAAAVAILAEIMAAFSEADRSIMVAFSNLFSNLSTMIIMIFFYVRINLMYKEGSMRTALTFCGLNSWPTPLGTSGEAPEAYGYLKLGANSSTFALIRTHSGLHSTFRHRIPPGCRRAEWICTCGQPMFKDIAAVYEVPHNYPYKNTNQPQQSALSTSHGGSAQEAIATGATSSPSLTGGSATITIHDQTRPGISGVPQQQRDNNNRRFLELCVNTGQYITRLGEIEVSTIISDGDLFERICRKYSELRGRRFKHILMHPVDIHYVKFNVNKKYQVGIRDKPIVLPPSDEVRKGNYAYTCPDLPPMDRNEFLHHFHHSADDHPEAVYLERLPKKVGGPLCDVRTQDGTRAWGVHIIEGPNRVVLTWCCVVIEIISFVVSVVYTITMQTQEQGFGIGSWMLTVLATSLTALYFQWEDA